MASSVRSCLLLVLCIVLLSISSSNAAGLIDTICPKTTNPRFCFYMLRADRRTAKANIRQLDQISIGYATNTAKEALALVQNLIKQGDDALNRRYYVPCSRYYSDAIQALNAATQLLNSGRLKDVRNQSLNALLSGQSCQFLFISPPPKPSPLTPYSSTYSDLASIVFVISENLS